MRKRIEENDSELQVQEFSRVYLKKLHELCNKTYTKQANIWEIVQLYANILCDDYDFWSESFDKLSFSVLMALQIVQ